MKQRALKFLGTVLFLLSACTGKSPGSEDFAQGLQLASGGQSREAREAFEKACLQNNATACFLAGKAVERDKLRPLPILQGVTSGDTTQIHLTARKDARLSVHLWRLETLERLAPVSENVQGHPGSPWITTTVRFEGLDPSVPYSLVVTEGRDLRDTRRVQSRDLSRPGVRLAVASCMDDGVKAQKRMWTELLSHAPDYLFLIGDNVYADHEGGKRGVVTTPDLLWRRYAETRLTLELFRSETLVPVIGLWDDHDYGKNDGDRTFPHREAVTRIFQSFFAQQPVAGVWERGPGVSGRLTAWGHQFLFLDGRSFRSPRNVSPGTHFGAEQEDWLWSRLKNSPLPAWIIGGDQFFGAYQPFESYERLHPDSFREFLGSLKKIGRPLAFLSGDRHLAEVQEIEKAAVGFRTYEITSSGIHAKIFPGSFKEQPNKRRIAGNDASFNYLILESAARRGLKFTATGYGPGLKRLYRKTLSVDP